MKNCLNGIIGDAIVQIYIFSSTFDVACIKAEWKFSAFSAFARAKQDNFFENFDLPRVVAQLENKLPALVSSRIN